MVMSGLGQRRQRCSLSQLSQKRYSEQFSHWERYNQGGLRHDFFCRRLKDVDRLAREAEKAPRAVPHHVTGVPNLLSVDLRSPSAAQGGDSPFRAAVQYPIIHVMSFEVLSEGVSGIGGKSEGGKDPKAVLMAQPRRQDRSVQRSASLMRS
ncbi:hypothetical protein E4U34_006479 [Claviceps purpurea]|nr:hypothetical protein E4U34_006479 [Claviceps purpurea]